MKQAGRSATDHGGGKRRDVDGIYAAVGGSSSEVGRSAWASRCSAAGRALEVVAGHLASNADAACEVEAVAASVQFQARHCARYGRSDWGNAPRLRARFMSQICCVEPLGAIWSQ